MARIAGVDLPRNKHANIALTYIYGIGHPRAARILEEAKVDGMKKVLVQTPFGNSCHWEQSK